MKVMGIFGFMMDVAPRSERCVYELLVEKKEWKNIFPMEFVVSAIGVDKEIKNGIRKIPNTVDLIVKGNERETLWWGKQEIDGEESALDFQYHGYKEAEFCFRNPNPKRRVRIRLDIRFITREKTVSSVRDVKFMQVEPVLNSVDSIIKYVSAQLDTLSKSEERLLTTSSMLWTCQVLCAVNTVFILLALGIWQVLALKRFFKNKKLV